MRQYELQPAYVLAEPPQAEVLTAAALHAHLRLDDDEEHPLIGGYIRAATELVETDSRTLLRPAALTLKVDRFPCGKPLLIERCPVTALTAVRYIDVSGESQVWDPDEYIAALASRPARLQPAYGRAWPVARSQPHAVEVDFEAGFAAGQCPETALQMIQLLVGHWFEHREAAGRVGEEIAFAYTQLLSRLQWQE